MKEISSNFKMISINKFYYNPNKIISIGDLTEFSKDSCSFMVAMDNNKGEQVFFKNKVEASKAMFKLIHDVESSLSYQNLQEKPQYSPTIFSH